MLPARGDDVGAAAVPEAGQRDAGSEHLLHAGQEHAGHVLAPQDKQALTAAYRATIATKLMPALARLAAFLEKEYLPATRTSTGWSALPNGAGVVPG